jgi:hypothetical protein
MFLPWGKEKDKILIPKECKVSTYSNVLAKDKKEKKKKKKLGFRGF